MNQFIDCVNFSKLIVFSQEALRYWLDLLTTSTAHTDPELQAIVQGLEVSSPSFRAIFGVLFCDYDVSQGLRG